MVNKHIADHGFLTFAVGVPYLRLARAQAMTIKLTQSIKNFAVVVDVAAAKELSGIDHELFDHIIVLDRFGDGWDMKSEWMAFNLSPWKHTFKTDADMIFPASIDHWWTSLQHTSVTITSSVCDFRGDEITSRWHRKIFDANHLPNVYSAMTYFRYSKEAARFFDTAMKITKDWDWFARELLIKNDDTRPRTDEIFALTAMICDDIKAIIPSSIPTFVHMKEKLNDLSGSNPWYEQLTNYWIKDKLFVGNIPQKLPFHYHRKDWMTDELYGRIQRDYQESRASL